MKTLYFDCFSGASGDMCVGALRDLGVSEDVFLDAVAAVDSHIAARFERRTKLGIAGWKFLVEEHDHHDSHSHHRHDHKDKHGHHREHRHYADIRTLIEESQLTASVKQRVQAVFRRIAVAEARIHGKDVETVAFHEVGAVDSIADIVAACAGLDSLAPARIIAAPLVEGTGFVSCAHGDIPLPAPATLAILEGIPLRQVAEQHEFITPTGAAILAEFCESFTPMPEMNISAIGYGIGTRDTPPRPNVLRLVLGETQKNETLEEITVLETQVDDTTPEILAGAAQALRDAGALDVFTAPIQMKKGRLGFLLTVICKPSQSNILIETLLRETTTFGVRTRHEHRVTLDREMSEVETRYGRVAVKIGRLGSSGENVLHSTPEWESCHALAKQLGVPAKDVYAAAQCATSQ